MVLKEMEWSEEPATGGKPISIALLGDGCLLVITRFLPRYATGLFQRVRLFA